MRKNILIAALLVFAFGLTGCETTDTMGDKAVSAAPDAEKAAYEKALMAAEAAIKEAKGVGGEWRDTGKTLGKAEAAAKDGDYKKATKLAKQAQWEGSMGYQQAMEEKNAGNPPYLK